MKSRNDVIAILQSVEVKTFLHDHWFAHLYLFGSFANEQNTEWSDIDLLYEENGKVDLWLEFFDVVNFLNDKLWTEVDLIEIKYIHPRLKSSIEKSVYPVF